ncbi:hypothetical protein LOK49_LG11G01008 [Camellia lanceoleosa]|uniref:Uncharacterized protein n=1 Tax=Camellia lanceoleosa TaxID=1840588 RepID=A0ACC0G1U9_9ERIC|nr:hypothetical protein LOK49_Contig100G00010 [Camellia lanceoleosa]KAI7994890.1 hypothetical protein LOK49_LG11G01008 [Camellia lanceoleosa]
MEGLVILASISEVEQGLFTLFVPFKDPKSFPSGTMMDVAYAKLMEKIGLASNKITVGLAREVTRIDKFNSGKGKLSNACMKRLWRESEFST